MTSEEKEVLQNLLKLCDFWIARGKPLSKCPDKLAHWRLQGRQHRDYRKAQELLNESK